MLKRVATVPAMRDVPSELAAAHWRELNARAEVDGLIVLARDRGMTWHQIAAAVGITRQGAMARYNRVCPRLE